MAAPSVGERPHRVRDLNDTFRRSFSGGRVVVTAGIASLPVEIRNEFLAAVRGLDADNYLHEDHDFGPVAVGDVHAFWKIDRYSAALDFASPDPANPTTTVRVLTVMLAEEY